MRKKQLVLKLGTCLSLALGVLSAASADTHVTTAVPAIPQESKATTIANLDIVLDCLTKYGTTIKDEDALKHLCEIRGVDPTTLTNVTAVERFLEPYLQVFKPEYGSHGILENSKPGLDPLKNPGECVEISALLHIIHFPHDLNPIPGYKATGEGKVVFGDYNYSLAMVAAAARAIVGKTPALLNAPLKTAHFTKLADIIITNDALVAYVNELKAKI